MSTPTEVIGTIPLERIRSSEANPRKHFDEQSIRELAASIGERGLLRDPVVRPIGGSGKFSAKSGFACDHYEIVCGERRLRAIREHLGWTQVQCKVRVMTDAEAADARLIENDQREDVLLSERARAYAAHAATSTIEETARHVGKSIGYVRDLVRMASLPDCFLEAVDTGSIGTSVAGLVARVPGEASRRAAAACVLAGELAPGTLYSGDGGPWLRVETPLTFRETKQLIDLHFCRQLKGVPFSRRQLDLVPSAGSCDACPKRAGNDPDLVAEGVRGDVCTDVDCFGRKKQAYRDYEIQKFAKKSRCDNSSIVVIGEPFRGELPPNGYCDLSQSILSAGLCLDEMAGGSLGTKTLGELLELVETPFHGVVSLAFDAKGKPRTLVKKGDLRKWLAAAGLLAKPEKTAFGTKPVARETSGGTATESPYKLYRITSQSFHQFRGIEFDAPSGTGDEQLAVLAFDAIIDSGVLDYGWEAIPDAEADDLPKPEPKLGQTKAKKSQAKTPSVDDSAKPTAELGQHSSSLCKPVGELKLSEIPGITADDFDCLAAVGILTLAALELKCDQVRKSHSNPDHYSPGIGSQIYEVLRVYKGAFGHQDILRIGDAILSHLGKVGDVTAGFEEIVKDDLSKPKSKKRKAVVA
jgi:ParB/RepB/Spo0J family partition protein